MKTLLISFLLLFFSVGAVQANDDTKPVRDESEFFAIVNETGGFIDKELHAEFWQILKSKYDEGQKTKIMADISSSLEMLKEFQAKTWQCAKDSYFAKKIEKSKDYILLRDQLVKQQGKYFSGESMVENSDKIIEASANRSPLDLGNGKFYITPELIEENTIGIKGGYERLKLLLQPEWKEDYKEYILPKINVSLLSLYAPDEYHDLISQGDEKIDIHIAQLAVNKNAVYEIGAVDYQHGEKKFVDMSKEEREIYIQEFVKEQLTSYKIENPLLSKGQWRDYEFSKGIGTIDGYNIVIMSLFVNHRALYIKYVTTANLSQAGSEFNDFTKRIQVLEKT